MTFSRQDLASIGGSVLLIVLARQRDGIGRWLRRPVPLWLGRVSYSLYLIHLPVLTAFLHLLVGTLPVPAILALAMPVVLGTAVLLHRLCEMPAQRLARSLTLAGGTARRGRQPFEQVAGRRPLARARDWTVGQAVR